MAMRDQFSVVLPSNSSMHIYPANTTAHFTSYLPHQLDLNDGEWSVALTEVILPMTFKHVQEGENIHFEIMGRAAGESEEHVFTLSSGIYESVDHLLEEINSWETLSAHLLFKCNRGGVVYVEQICGEKCKTTRYHKLVISKSLQQIFGFPKRAIKFKSGNDIVDSEDVLFHSAYGKKPAHLTSNMPNLLMIYSDILEPCVVGDVQARLLRTVPLNFENYAYGSYKVKNFSPPLYVPLLYTSFRSIDIDFRDQFGEPVAFDSGTSSVTLHFKRF